MDDDKFYDEVNSTNYQDYDEFKISAALRRCNQLESKCEGCPYEDYYIENGYDKCNQKMRDDAALAVYVGNRDAFKFDLIDKNNLEWNHSFLGKISYLNDKLKKKLTREEFEKAYEIAFDGFTKEEISEYCDEHFCNRDCKFFKRCMVEDIMDQNRSTPINPIDAEEYAYEILKEAGLK